MKELIAKRYVKALVESLDDTTLKSFLTSLEKISALYGVEKFQTILSSPDVTKEQKMELVELPLENEDKKMKNFLKILNENNRLMLIPSIKDELQKQVSQKENIYEGEVYSDWRITKAQITKLENGFSKKFGATVKLNAAKSEYPGLKISVDGLGIEASFSVERLKAQITEHILKAI